ncbi:MAG: nucleotidyltransferase family protein [Candidatus Doudnabacteria bacterium]|nr:nucleotidyltransferase family protein [Candidatus Doudnabacteria bacterium]
MTSQEVIEIYSKADKAGIKFWIDGGWCMDALLGEQTRPHSDLDIAIQEKDVLNFRKLLEPQGYKDIKIEDARPHNFVLGDDNGREVDIHVIVLDDKGNGIYGPLENGQQMYPAQGLTGKGVIDGQEVRCISPEIMVEFIAPWVQKHKEKYVKNLKALCDKFGIEYPQELKKLLKR